MNYDYVCTHIHFNICAFLFICFWLDFKCARRWFDESDPNHLANMGKYVSAMVAAGARLTYATQSNGLWFGVVLVTSIVATVYQLYWDFVKDWGLLNPNSKNPWLRDDLMLKNKSFYYISIVSYITFNFVHLYYPFRRYKSRSHSSIFQEKM